MRRQTPIHRVGEAHLSLHTRGRYEAGHPRFLALGGSGRDGGA